MIYDHQPEAGNLEIPPPGVKGGENGAAGDRLKRKWVEGLKRWGGGSGVGRGSCRAGWVSIFQH